MSMFDFFLIYEINLEKKKLNMVEEKGKVKQRTLSKI